MATFTSTAQSSSLSRSHDVSFTARTSSLCTSLRVNQSSAGSRLSGSTTESSLLRIRSCRYQSLRQQSLSLSRIHDVSFTTRSSCLSTTSSRANQSSAGSRRSGSATDSSLLRIRTCRYQSLRQPSVSGHGNLICSAAKSGEEEFVQSGVVVQAAAVAVDEGCSRCGEAAPAGAVEEVAEWAQPYLQLARVNKAWLGGPWLLFLWPCLWGVALAGENGSVPDARIVALLAVASSILRTAACILNDLCDKDFDGKVERTKQRPLVTGVVSPLQGWIFLGVQALLYVAVLSQLEAFRLGSQFQVHIALQLFFNCIYPLTKRWTHWTPVYLGLAINWSVFLGWTAVRPSGNLPSSALLPVLIFFAACCQTLVYETIYAHQDVNDDVQAGIKSLAILLGDQSKLWFAGFGTAFVASLTYAGSIAALGWPFYTGVAVAGAHVAWQIISVDMKNPADCSAKFRSNKWVGAFVFGGIVCAKLLA